MTDHVRRRNAARVTAALLLLALLAVMLFLFGGAGSKPAAAADPPSASITVKPRDLRTGSDLAQFTYIVNEDNAHLGNAADVKDRPLRAPTSTFSPIAAEGNQDRATVSLPSDCTNKPNVARDGHGCRYLISARSGNHKMWGKHITLPADAGNVPIDLSEASAARPLPSGKLRFFVFNDSAWTNAAPDAEEVDLGGGTGMGGFHVTLEEQTNSQVSVDYHNRPLCSGASGSITGTPGDCTTQGDGFIQINDLSPATYNVYVTPPATPCNSDPNSHWVQTTTFDGGLGQQAGVEEGADGSVAPGELLWEPPNRRTGIWAGFVCVPSNDLSSGGTGSISGRALNWQGFPPFDTLVYDTNHPVEQPYIALTDSTSDRTVYTGRGDSAGNFNIPDVPAGDYTLSVWDEQLSYIIRFLPVTVGNGENVDLHDVGVSRWFGWLDGTTYLDKNGNGKFDQGVDSPIPNTDMDQRWNDGSIKESTFTDATGHYEYPTAEGGAIGKWFIGEQGFSRFSAFPGPSVHDEHNPANVLASCSASAGRPSPCLPTDLGGGLLTNQLVSEGHQTTVDWGKQTYPAGTPGQIVGITYFATTRNEFNGRFSAHEDYEPAVPNVTVRLESAAELGPDLIAGTADDPPWDPKYVVNEYVTDKWQKPGASTDGQTCAPIRDKNGNDITADFHPAIAPDCLEVPINGVQTKDGAFDGGYAFADYCANGFDENAPSPDSPCWNAGHTDHVGPSPLVAGKYVTRAIMPKDPHDTRSCNPTTSTQGQRVSNDPLNPDPKGCLYHIQREEDVNVDLGAQITPAIPPPPCAGDQHVLDQATTTSRSTLFTGNQGTSPSMPLCDMRLVELKNQANANADFFLMTNFPTAVQNPSIAPSHPDAVGDVPAPGRLFGAVFNDIYFDRDPKSIWYGEPRAIGDIPIGIYGIDAPPSGATETSYKDWRLVTTVTTDENGSYEALLPSTETFNCPIPQGPCPGMYIVVVNDPGSKAHPNPNYNPGYLTASRTWDVWPGKTDVQLDTPLDPIAGSSCSQSRVEPGGGVTSTKPELLQVRKVTDVAGDTMRASTEQGPFVRSGDSGNNRRVAIDADFIGPAGSTGLTGGHVVLTDQRTGDVTNLTRANGGILSWTPGTTSVADRIVIQVPATSGSFVAGPKQLDIVTSTSATGGAQSTSNGITLHVLGGSGATAYTPGIVKALAPTLTGHELQNAIDGAPDNAIVVLSPGIYHENLVMWKPLKLQGIGPGGLIGAHEQQAKQPDDPRFNILGSTLDGRFFKENQVAWDAVVNAHRPAGDYAGVSGTNPVIPGADVTVVARTTTSYANGLTSARIDGIGGMSGQGQGAGGIQLQAYANNVRISNNVLESNAGVFAGGIGVGQPYVRDGSGNNVVGQGSHNYNVQIRHNRLYGNGGLTRSGGIGVFGGSNNYDIGSNYICGNFGVEYGAGVSHWGNSTGGAIHDNEILYNDAVSSGAGIAIADQTTGADQPLGPGSGTVDVDRNHLQGNFSGDDGGAMFVMNALTSRINVRNNLIVDNGAADMGSITLDDSSNVALVNNTVANNASTGSCEGCLPIDQGGDRRSAGLASEANDPRFQAMLPPSAPHFSNPVALFNNVFRNNEAFLLSTAGPGAALVSQGFLDFEVRGGSSTDTFTPRYSILTNGTVKHGATNGSVPGGQGNNVGADPGFVTPYTLQLAVAGSRLDPQRASVTINGADPADGIPGDYHITAGSPAIDNGVRCALTPFPAPANALASCTSTSRGVQAPTGVPSTANPSGGDFDGDFRPMLRTLRLRTPWDMGADELLGFPLPLP
jgi:hypothetical protein